tara:strand:- start:5097 stop:6644 length:1548 start_codon:yes stop_codon:yes gene_type:complete
VYLTDKANVANSIANPITILSQKAIDRKNAHNVVIDKRDVPVNEVYIAQLKLQTGIIVMAKSKWFNAVHVRGSELDIKALKNLSFVNSIDFADKSLNTLKRTQSKKESKFQETTTVFNYGSAVNQIQMFNGDQLHLANFTGTEITVAVLDAAFPNVDGMASFQRLRDGGHIKGTYDFVNRDPDVYVNNIGDPSNHGTLVLSTMAGYVQDTFVGTAPDADYYLFITEDNFNENPVEESYWVEAAERADSLGVDVINTSLGYGSFYDNTKYNYPATDFDGSTIYITRGANVAFEKGMLLVTSAGNEGTSGLNAPADAPGVFTIGAVDSNENYVTFSSIGSNIQSTQKPDVVAQGQNSSVIFENDGIGTANGTSFSSPIMAGGIACLWQALPNKSNAEIMQLVRESSSQYNTPDHELGYGIPDLQLALDLGLASENAQSKNIEVKMFPNPTDGIMYLSVPSNLTEISIQLFDMLGKQVLNFPINTMNKKFDITFLSRGIYIAKIQSKTILKSFKIIKT